MDVNDLDAIDEQFRDPAVTSRSLPSLIVENYRAVLSDERLGVFYFDDLKTRPDWLRSEIVQFITGQPETGESSLNPGFNSKADLAKAEWSPAARAHVEKLFAPEIAKCKDMFGDAVDGW